MLQENRVHKNTLVILLGLNLTLALAGCAWLPGHPQQTPTAAVPVPIASEPITKTRSGITPPPRPAQQAQKQGNPDLWRKLGMELRMVARHPRSSVDPTSFFPGNLAFIHTASERARPFLSYIYSEIERRQLPFEIALIPIVESAYNPKATSPGGAAGLWQFIPATGRHFGLYQSRWYDGRRDVIASTTAALDYFELLRDRFMGDWELVFAAYNCGERTVEMAMERNAKLGLPTDFNSLELPATTTTYVPKLLALAEIISHPEAYSLELAKISSTPHFEIIDVGSGLDLNTIIAWSDMPAAEFDFLNAGFRQRFTVAGAPTTVLVERARAAEVNRALASLPDSERSTAHQHIVARGETLSQIAMNTGISVATIMQANNLHSHRLALGQVLSIPGPRAAAHVVTKNEARESRAARPATVHIVKAADNLWDVARKYHTTVAQLASTNKLAKGASLKIGQKLSIPHAGVNVATTKSALNADYNVRAGDSLWTISRRFKVSMAKLKRWNQLIPNTHLQPGQRLFVAAPPEFSDL